MNTLIRNIGFSSTGAATTSSTLIPAGSKIVGLQMAAVYDTIVDGGASYIYASLSGALPSFTGFPAGLEQQVGSIIAHWRSIVKVITSGVSNNLITPGYIPIPGILIKAQQPLYVHAACAVGTIQGVLLIHLVTR